MSVGPVFTTNGTQSDFASVVNVCVDTSLNGTCDTPLATEGGNTDSYRLPKGTAALGDPIRILVEFNIDSSAVDDEFDSWALVAAVTDPDDADALAELDTNGRVMLGSSETPTNVADDPNAVQNVFGDATGTLGYDFVADVASTTADGGNDGQHSDSSQFYVQGAVMSIAKTSRVVWDPINGFGFGYGPTNEPPFDDTPTGNNPKRLPGAVIEYTVTVDNDSGAGADATDVTIADSAPTGTEPVLAGTIFGDDEDPLPNIYIDACGGAVDYAEDVAEDVDGGFSAVIGTCTPGDAGSVIFYVVIE